MSMQIVTLQTIMIEVMGGYRNSNKSDLVPTSNICKLLISLSILRAIINIKGCLIF